MKTRCRECRRLIDFGNTYCPSCYSKYIKKKKETKTKENKEADALINNSRWRSLRKQIIIRDKGCCLSCFIKGRIEYRQLQVHHIIKRSEDASLAFEPTNLVTVCRTCHEEVELLSVSEQKKLFNIDEISVETHYLL